MARNGSNHATFWHVLLGVGIGAAGIVAVEAGLVATGLRNLQMVHQSADGYKVTVLTNKQGFNGYMIPVIVEVTQYGAPVQNMPVSLSVSRHSGTETYQYVTDVNGNVMFDALAFNTPVLGLAASVKTPGGQVITDNLSVVLRSLPQTAQTGG